ncbi:MAG TPA: hypothetical protein VH351_06305 [Bryobacteraceae bacterium]|nr:hypothetical protein [Bryobacteraceae bacterium]
MRRALEGPVSEACPASLVQRHPNAYVYLDLESASRLAILRPAAETIRHM